MKIKIEITLGYSALDKVQNLISELYYISGVKEVKTEYKDEEELEDSNETDN